MTFLARTQCSPDNERGAWAAIIILAILVVGVVAWFVALQAIVLKAFCPVCMVTHACGFLAAILCLSCIPIAPEANTPMWTQGSDQRGIPRQALSSLILLGFVGVIGLAAGQIMFPKHRNIIALLPTVVGKGVTKAPQGIPKARASVATQATNLPPSPEARLVGPRLLSLYSGQFQIDLGTVPMIGLPDAPHIIVYLFDYGCPHCRTLHGILKNTQLQLSNRLGVVCLPMPMSTNCNKLIPAKFNTHSNACDYARLGLAVWLAKPEAKRQFDDWLFTPEHPVLVTEAKSYAIGLVGAERLEVALSDPSIANQIQIDCQIHFANWQATGRPTMPQLILGKAISLGPLISVEHLLALLNRYVGIEPD